MWVQPPPGERSGNRGFHPDADGAQAQARVWDRLFSQVPLEKKRAERDWGWLVGRLRRAGVRTVLDLGAGQGYWSIALARAGFQVTALDISQVAMERLRTWAREGGLAIETWVLPAHQLPTARRFDAVIANSVLDHMTLAQAREVLRRVNAVLNPRGLLYLSFDAPGGEAVRPHLVLPDGTWCYRGGKWDGMLWRPYRDEEIASLCAGLGLEILEFTVRESGARAVWARPRGG